MASHQLNYLARLREELESDEGSSVDEGAAATGECWKGVGRPLQVGVGYTVRGYCDGQSLASLGRWPAAARRYPETSTWREVAQLFDQFSQQYGNEELLMNLALGRVEAMPFPAQKVASPKGRIIEVLHAQGFVLQRVESDRAELPLDFRFIDLLLRSADDPERNLGTCAQGLKVGPGTRMPRMQALNRPKRRWALTEPRDPMNYLLEEQQSENPGDKNCASMAGLSDKSGSGSGGPGNQAPSDQAYRGRGS